MLEQTQISVSEPRPAKTEMVQPRAQPARPVFVIPSAQISDQASQTVHTWSKDKKDHGYYGKPLIQRGLLVLGCVLVGSSAWYYGAYIIKGQEPTVFPAWLGAAGGLLVTVSFGLMFLGSQDENPKIHSRRSGSGKEEE